MAREAKKRIVTKKHLARMERERRQRRIILGGALAVVFLVIALTGYGVLELFVLRPIQPVAKVNTESISTRDFQTRTRYARQTIVQRYNEMAQLMQMFGEDPSTQEYIQSNLSQIALQLEPTSLGQQILDGMIEDQLIRQEAARRGITVTDEEIDIAMQEAFGYFPDGTPTPAPTVPASAPPTLSPTQFALISPTPLPTPTEEPTAVPTGEAEEEADQGGEEEAEQADPTPTEIPGPTSTPAPVPTATPYTLDAFQADYKNVLDALSQSINYREDNFREMFESQLYREKVMEAVLVDLSREQEQVWARHILVAEEATAQEVLSRLQDGEDFGALAEEFSTDFSATTGGDLGWFTLDDMHPEFGEQAFAMEIGEISQPVQTIDGWHIIQALGRDVRTLPDEEYARFRQLKFQEWLDAQRQASDVEIYDYWIERVPTTPDILGTPF